MKCEEIRDRMPDMAAGFDKPTADENTHLAGCTECAEQLKRMQQTMSLLDEWKVPEPSPYFDTRLQARLREEMTKPQRARWFAWFRQPVLAAALTVVMGVGVGLFFARNNYRHAVTDAAITAPPGSAVSDLQALDKNSELYSDFEVLDDLQVQQDVNASQ